jgi:hypothetical protein
VSSVALGWEGGCWYDMRLLPGAGLALFMPLPDCEPDCVFWLAYPLVLSGLRICEAFRRTLLAGGASLLRSARALAMGSSSSRADCGAGEGGPCREGMRGSGIDIVGGAGGGPMEDRRWGRLSFARAGDACDAGEAER